MGSYHIAETAVVAVEGLIQSQIASALANVRGIRTDNVVTTEPPKSYFRYEMADVYRAPGIFTIIRGTDLNEEARGPNHINATHEILVAAVVEDRKKDLVTLKAWRYQAALMQILHGVQLTSDSNAVKLFSRVKRCEFSGLVDIKSEDSPDAVFRKEVSLRLTVEHIETLE